MVKKILITMIIILCYSPVFAENIFISGHKGLGVPATYPNWTENSEDKLLGVSYICMAENPASSGSEEALSPNATVSGVSLTLTAVGDPGGTIDGMRYFDGDDGLAFDGGAIPDAITGTSDFTIIVKIKTYSPGDGGYVFAVESPSAAEYILMVVTAGVTKLQVDAGESGASSQQLTTTNALADDTEYYVVFVTDTTKGFSWAGFIEAGTGSGKVGQPTVGSDFTSGNTVEFAGAYNNLPYNIDREYKHIMSLTTGSLGLQGYWEYVILDDSVLINTDL